MFKMRLFSPGVLYFFLWPPIFSPGWGFLICSSCVPANTVAHAICIRLQSGVDLWLLFGEVPQTSPGRHTEWDSRQSSPCAGTLSLTHTNKAHILPVHDHVIFLCLLERSAHFSAYFVSALFLPVGKLWLWVLILLEQEPPTAMCQKVKKCIYVNKPPAFVRCTLRAHKHTYWLQTHIWSKETFFA